MIILYRDPQCKSVVVKIEPEDVPGTTETVFDSFVSSQAYDKMQKKIKDLESQVQLQERKLKLYSERDGSLNVSPEVEKSLSQGSKSDNEVRGK